MTIVFTATLAWTANAQTSQPPDMSRQNGGRPPQPPILAALDLNSDNTISSDELANAPAALKKLDKNGDGRLSSDECRPTHPNRGVGMGGQPGGSSDNMGHPPSGESGGPGMSGANPPKMPLDAALDADGDGTIDADEIANASAALLTLDKNGDGQLAMNELMPERPGSGNRDNGGADSNF
jgi:hypothetical protein